MATANITLKLIAQDLASGNIAKAVGGIDKLAQRGGIMGSVFQGVGVSMGMMLNPLALMTRGVGMVTDVMGDAVDAASDLEESQSKVEQVFTDSADVINEWASDSAKAFGLSEAAALEAAGTFGNFIQALGNTEEESNKMSRSIVELAADLASFNNTGIDEVILALRSGLAGEAEPMRRLGVSISAARVEAYILAKGMAAAKSQITDAMKVSARYAIIMDDTTKAQGDFTRTSDGLANSQRQMAAEMDNAMAALGKALTPVLADLANFVSDVIPGIIGFLDDLGDSFNNLWRWSSRQIEVTGDYEQALRDQAQMVGLNSDEIVEMVNQMRRLADAQDVQARVTDLRSVALDQMAASLIDVAYYEGELITDLETAKVAFLENVDAEEALRAKTADLTTMQEEAANEMYLAVDAINAQKEAFLVLGDVGNKSALAVHASMGQMSAAFVSTAGIAKGATGTIIRAVADLGPSLARTIKDNKVTVRKAMWNLRWAMEHPFAGDKYVNFLKKQQEAANRKLVEAIDAGNIDATNAAAALVDSIDTELSRIDDRTYSVSVFVDSSGRRRASTTARNPGDYKEGATGATYYPGDWGLVGERGPERIRNEGGVTTITPMGGASGTTIVIQGGTYLGTQEDAQRWAAWVVPVIERERRRMAL